MKKILPCCLLFLGLNSVESLSVPASYEQYCAYLNDKIYCYGGSDSTGDYINTMYSLNVQKENATNVNELAFQWDMVIPSINFAMIPRTVAQTIASPDRTKMYIQGGYNDLGNALQHSFIMFDANTTSWTSLPDFEQYNLIDHPIRRGTVSYVPSVNKLVFYGGLMDHLDNSTVTVDGLEIVPTDDYLYFGFHNLTTFDMTTNQWQQISNATNEDSDFIYALTSIYHPDTSTTYFIGGREVDRTNTTLSGRVTFETVSGVFFPAYRWDKYSCIGTVPGDRDRFSTTLLPDKKTVLMYGGVQNSITSADYCHLLNLENKEWRPCRVADPLGTTAPRRSHSAVLVGDYLFILFGLDASNSARSDMLILDVADANNITFVQNYLYKNSAIATEDSEMSEGNSSGLGTGAIVGIAVGCVVLIAVIAGVIFFIRKKKTPKKEESLDNFPEDWEDLGEKVSRIDENMNPFPSNHPPTEISSPMSTVAPHSYYVVKPIESTIVKPQELTEVNVSKPFEMTLVSKPHHG